MTNWINALKRLINEKYKFLYSYCEEKNEFDEGKQMELWKELFNKIIKLENSDEFEAWYIQGLKDWIIELEKLLKLFENATYSMQELEGSERPKINFEDMILDIKNAREKINNW